MKLVTFEKRRMASSGEIVGDKVIDLSASGSAPTETRLGTNYKKHLPRTHRSPPLNPSVLDKRRSCLDGPFDAGYAPRATPKFHCEVAE